MSLGADDKKSKGIGSTNSVLEMAKYVAINSSTWVAAGILEDRPPEWNPNLPNDNLTRTTKVQRVIADSLLINDSPVIEQTLQRGNRFFYPKTDVQGLTPVTGSPLLIATMAPDQYILPVGKELDPETISALAKVASDDPEIQAAIAKDEDLKKILIRDAMYSTEPNSDLSNILKKHGVTWSVGLQSKLMAPLKKFLGNEHLNATAAHLGGPYAVLSIVKSSMTEVDGYDLTSNSVTQVNQSKHTDEESNKPTFVEYSYNSKVSPLQRQMVMLSQSGGVKLNGSGSDMESLIGFYDETVGQGIPLAVHCMDGVDRTGIMITALSILHQFKNGNDITQKTEAEQKQFLLNLRESLRNDRGPSFCSLPEDAARGVVLGYLLISVQKQMNFQSSATFTNPTLNSILETAIKNEIESAELMSLLNSFDEPLSKNEKEKLDEWRAIVEQRISSEEQYSTANKDNYTENFKTDVYFYESTEVQSKTKPIEKAGIDEYNKIIAAGKYDIQSYKDKNGKGIFHYATQTFLSNPNLDNLKQMGELIKNGKRPAILAVEQTLIENNMDQRIVGMALQVLENKKSIKSIKSELSSIGTAERTQLLQQLANLSSVGDKDSKKIFKQLKSTLPRESKAMRNDLKTDDLFVALKAAAEKFAQYPSKTNLDKITTLQDTILNSRSSSQSLIDTLDTLGLNMALNISAEMSSVINAELQKMGSKQKISARKLLKSESNDKDNRNIKSRLKDLKQMLPSKNVALQNDVRINAEIEARRIEAVNSYMKDQAEKLEQNYELYKRFTKGEPVDFTEAQAKLFKISIQLSLGPDVPAPIKDAATKILKDIDSVRIAQITDDVDKKLKTFIEPGMDVVKDKNKLDNANGHITNLTPLVAQLIILVQNYNNNPNLNNLNNVLKFMKDNENAIGSRVSGVDTQNMFKYFQQEVFDRLNITDVSHQKVLYDNIYSTPANLVKTFLLDKIGNYESEVINKLIKDNPQAAAEEENIRQYYLSLLKKIELKEFDGLAWSRRDAKEAAPNIYHLTEKLNNFSFLVVQEIYDAQDDKKRLEVYQKYCGILAQAIKNNDTGIINAVYAAFVRSDIARLDLINKVPNPEEIKALMSIAEKLTNSELSFKRQRAAEGQAEKEGRAFVSSLPTFLNDMTFAHDGNLDENGNLKASGREMLDSLLQKFSQRQSHVNEERPDTSAFEQKISNTVYVYDQDTGYKRSLEILPKGGAKPPRQLTSIEDFLIDRLKKQKELTGNNQVALAAATSRVIPKMEDTAAKIKDKSITEQELTSFIENTNIPSEGIGGLIVSISTVGALGMAVAAVEKYIEVNLGQLGAEELDSLTVLCDSAKKTIDDSWKTVDEAKAKLVELKKLKGSAEEYKATIPVSPTVTTSVEPSVVSPPVASPLVQTSKPTNEPKQKNKVSGFSKLREMLSKKTKGKTKLPPESPPQPQKINVTSSQNSPEVVNAIKDLLVKLSEVKNSADKGDPVKFIIDEFLDNVSTHTKIDVFENRVNNLQVHSVLNDPERSNSGLKALAEIKDFQDQLKLIKIGGLDESSLTSEIVSPKVPTVISPSLPPSPLSDTPELEELKKQLIKGLTSIAAATSEDKQIINYYISQFEDKINISAVNKYVDELRDHLKYNTNHTDYRENKFLRSNHLQPIHQQVQNEIKKFKDAVVVAENKMKNPTTSAQSEDEKAWEGVEVDLDNPNHKLPSGMPIQTVPVASPTSSPVISSVASLPQDNSLPSTPKGGRPPSIVFNHVHPDPVKVSSPSMPRQIPLPPAEQVVKAICTQLEENKSKSKSSLPFQWDKIIKTVEEHANNDGLSATERLGEIKKYLEDNFVNNSRPVPPNIKSKISEILQKFPIDQVLKAAADDKKDNAFRNRK